MERVEEMSDAKERVRGEVLAEMAGRESGPGRGSWGKAAEKLRNIKAYQTAQNVLVSPAASLLQVRLNVLTDRKRLTMATPGLQKGFVLLEPEGIPFQKRSLAVRAGQDNPFAKKLAYDVPLKRPVDLIVTDALAISRDGSLLGDGHGHLDIQFAVLATLRWLHPQVRVLAIVQEEQILPSVPAEKTDVRAHWIVTPQEVYETARTDPPEAEVIWDKLDMKQIRRNDALFHLYKRLHPLPQSVGEAVKR